MIFIFIFEFYSVRQFISVVFFMRAGNLRLDECWVFWYVGINNWWISRNFMNDSWSKAHKSSFSHIFINDISWSIFRSVIIIIIRKSRFIITEIENFYPWKFQSESTVISSLSAIKLKLLIINKNLLHLNRFSEAYDIIR